MRSMHPFEVAYLTQIHGRDHARAMAENRVLPGGAPLTAEEETERRFDEYELTNVTVEDDGSAYVTDPEGVDAAADLYNLALAGQIGSIALPVTAPETLPVPPHEPAAPMQPAA